MLSPSIVSDADDRNHARRGAAHNCYRRTTTTTMTLHPAMNVLPCESAAICAGNVREFRPIYSISRNVEPPGLRGRRKRNLPSVDHFRGARTHERRRFPPKMAQTLTSTTTKPRPSISPSRGLHAQGIAGSGSWKRKVCRFTWQAAAPKNWTPWAGISFQVTRGPSRTTVSCARSVKNGIYPRVLSFIESSAALNSRQRCRAAPQETPIPYRVCRARHQRALSSLRRHLKRWVVNRMGA